MALLDPALAVKELDRVLALGARVICMVPGPMANRSPADPVFDGFWSRINEAGIPVTYHIGEPGYNEMYAPTWGENPNPSAFEISAFQFCNFHGDRPGMETLSGLIFFNLFGRYPNVKLMSVEQGTHWVPYLLKQMDKSARMGRNGPWPGGRITELPSVIFKEHVYPCPYPEEDVRMLVELLGPDHVIFGSDFPHPEGLARPLEYTAKVDGLPESTQRAILGGTARRLLGVESR
jgi:predicted TIM-barrel fold metal-dependent hydrolase